MEIKNFFATDASGNIMPSALVYVYLGDTTTLATGVRDISNNLMSNPFESKENGLIQFKAPNNTYDVRVVKGAREYTLHGIQCADLVDVLEQTASFLGSHDTPPTARNDGTTLREGDKYFNTVVQAEYIYTSAGWQINDSLVALNELKSEIHEVSTANGIPRAGDAGTLDLGWLDSDVARLSDLFVSSYSNLRAYGGGAQVITLIEGSNSGRFRKISATSSGYVDDGGITIISDNGSVWQRINAERIQAGWYMPPGDGVTNAYTQIQAALNAARGRTLVLQPDKVYLNASMPWEYPSNLIVEGERASLKKGFTSNTVGEVKGSSLIRGKDIATSNVSMRNLILDANGPVLRYASNIFECLKGTATNITLDRCDFLDNCDLHAIDIDGGNLIKITQCRFLGFAVITPAEGSFREAIQLPGSGAGLQNAIVADCYFGPNPNNTDPGFGSWACAVGNHSNNVNVVAGNYQISRCIFDRLTYVAVRPFAWSDVSISDSQFLSCAMGIVFEQGTAARTVGCVRPKVKGCVFLNCTNSIKFNSTSGYKHKFAIIEGNSFESSGVCIEAKDLDNFNFSNNTANNCTQFLKSNGPLSNGVVSGNTGQLFSLNFIYLNGINYNIAFCGNVSAGTGAAAYEITGANGDQRRNISIDANTILDSSGVAAITVGSGASYNISATNNTIGYGDNNVDITGTHIIQFTISGYGLIANNNIHQSMQSKYVYGADNVIVKQTLAESPESKISAAIGSEILFTGTGGGMYLKTTAGYTGWKKVALAA